MAEPQAVSPRLRLRWHVALLTAGLLALWPLLDLDGVFISDEGSYAVQERALSTGTWDMGYAFEGADPDARFQGFHGVTVSERGVFPYVQHPLWPAVLRASTSVFGLSVGLRAVGVGSVIVLAAAAWALASDLGGGRAGPWGFWLAAVSPALANAWILWAHAPSAAVGAVLVLAMLRSRQAGLWLAVAAIAAALGVLLRSEGLLWAGAVVAGPVLLFRDWRSIRTSVVVGAAAVAAFVGQVAWRRSIIGTGAAADDDLRSRAPGLTENMKGFQTALLDGGFLSSSARALGLVAVLLMAGAMVALWKRTEGSIVLVLLIASAVTLSIRLFIDLRDPAPGLLVAAPTLLLLAVWRARGRPGRWLPAAVGLFLLAIAATIYPDGGSLQWGGRFLSPCIGTLAALAGAAFADRLTDVTGRTRAMLVGGILSVLAIQAVGAVVVPNELRQLSEAPIRTVAAQDATVVVTQGGQVARLDWRGWPQRCWIAAPEGYGDSDLRTVLQVLEESGIEAATYAGIDPNDLRRAGAIVEPVEPGIGRVRFPQAAATLRIAAPYDCGR